MPQRKMAEKLDASTSWLNHCLKAFIDSGWVEVNNFNQNIEKFDCINEINSVGIVERALPAGRLLKQKMAEYGALKAEIGTPDSEFAI